MKPFLRWVGGKSKQTQILNRIMELYLEANCDRYLEPFAGAIGVTLFLEPKNAFVNDGNTAIIQLYQAIRNGFKYEFDNVKNIEFYELRDKINYCLKEGITDRYFLSMVLAFNQTCFNGIWRVNKASELNTPVGKLKGKTLMPHDVDFSEYADLFNSYEWQFSNLDYRELLGLPQNQSKFFVYLDPPYLDTFVGYAAKQWKASDRDYLLQYMAVTKNNVVMTEGFSDEIVTEILEYGLKYDKIAATRSVRPGHKPKVFEVVIRNFG